MSFETPNLTTRMLKHSSRASPGFKTPGSPDMISLPRKIHLTSCNFEATCPHSTTLPPIKGNCIGSDPPDVPWTATVSVLPRVAPACAILSSINGTRSPQFQSESMFFIRATLPLLPPPQARGRYILSATMILIDHRRIG